jgi:hypothetical protein
MRQQRVDQALLARRLWKMGLSSQVARLRSAPEQQLGVRIGAEDHLEKPATVHLEVIDVEALQVVRATVQYHQVGAMTWKLVQCHCLLRGRVFGVRTHVVFEEFDYQENHLSSGGETDVYIAAAAAVLTSRVG